MSTAITNQQSNQYLGLFYISSSDSGARTVTVTLSAAGGRANVQCSATTWTGLKGVDLSSTNESEDLSGFATTLTIRPTSPVPADEIFFGAIHRYVPRGAPALSLAEPGLNGSIVDSNTNEGNGSGFGCQPVSWADWEDCIGTAQLGSGRSSMTFLWATSGYALVAGVGLVEGTGPGTGSGGVDTILGIPTLVFGALILVVAIGVATVVVIMWRARLATRPPSR